MGLLRPGPGALLARAADDLGRLERARPAVLLERHARAALPDLQRRLPGAAQRARPARGDRRAERVQVPLELAGRPARALPPGRLRGQRAQLARAPGRAEHARDDLRPPAPRAHLARAQPRLRGAGAARAARERDGRRRRRAVSGRAARLPGRARARPRRPRRPCLLVRALRARRVRDADARRAARAGLDAPARSLVGDGVVRPAGPLARLVAVRREQRRRARRAAIAAARERRGAARGLRSAHRPRRPRPRRSGSRSAGCGASASCAAAIASR